MTLLEVIVLAIVQGVAEFLPISSSGHLVVVSELLGAGASTDLNIVLHTGTLLSILVFFWRRVLRLLVAKVVLHGVRQHALAQGKRSSA